MFKVICNDVVIDVLENIRYVRYLKKSGKIVNTDKTSAHGFYGSDNNTVYILEGRYCPPEGNQRIVKLVKITRAEYEELRDKLRNNIQVQADLIKLRAVKEEKLRELSSACNAAIVEGVDVLLSDGKYHRFRLTLEDQLNLVFVKDQITSGAQLILYHETDKVVRMFEARDMKRLLEAANKHRVYHTTYYNILKHCINNMCNSNDIVLIHYGTKLENLPMSQDVKYIAKEHNIV